ncbi:xanthosine utilization system XapX-like protein [Paenibacillus phyllosphaerae]|uniref:Xanthosine utilization system XapX-like protein n=1 Tax=Paenibacillus phyllosphaerae TaxID=274593 RepID=A0A7W5FQG4_9BACL|nr:MFS transporter [Paenibacillus phyllosphaerae]MBB3113248.1 xanthosine utilization system XapX-like protein [Paenibacillus phyllosphaerae]
MRLSTWLDTWKYPSILLISVGVTNIGAWIYLIALNLMLLDMTSSPLAISALYVIKPLATLCTNLWSGSLIDRMNKRRLMVALDLIRAALIVFMPLCTSMWQVFVLVFLVSAAGSIFGPASMAYVTKLIPGDQRPRYNSIQSFIHSGAFLTGPAAAGLLFLVGPPSAAIYVTAVAMLLSGLVLMLLPNVEGTPQGGEQAAKLSWSVVKTDLRLVIAFGRKQVYVMTIWFLYSLILVVIASAMDSLEVAFSKQVLGLTDSEYGLLVSTAGAGIMIGAFINTLVVKRAAPTFMVGIGTLGVCLGYLIYAFSHSFMAAAVGFVVLAFWLAFVNSGFATFYQANVPVEVMGRVGSLLGLIEAALAMLATLLFGAAAQWLSIPLVVMTGAVGMAVFGIMLAVCCLYGGRGQTSGSPAHLKDV